MYMNKTTGILWVNFSFFIIIISQKSVHKPKKNNTGKKTNRKNYTLFLWERFPNVGKILSSTLYIHVIPLRNFPLLDNREVMQPRQ